jgi:hypothetical protein
MQSIFVTDFEVLPACRTSCQPALKITIRDVSNCVPATGPMDCRRPGRGGRGSPSAPVEDASATGPNDCAANGRCDGVRWIRLTTGKEFSRVLYPNPVCFLSTSRRTGNSSPLLSSSSSPSPPSPSSSRRSNTAPVSAAAALLSGPAIGSRSLPSGGDGVRDYNSGRPPVRQSTIESIGGGATTTATAPATTPSGGGERRTTSWSSPG